MRLGPMRHKVQVLERRTTQTASGAQSTTWDAKATRWAAVRPLEGTEFYAAQHAGAKVPTEFRLRYFGDLVPRMRLQWGSKLFDVVSVAMVDGRTAEIRVLADELVEEPS